MPEDKDPGTPQLVTDEGEATPTAAPAPAEQPPAPSGEPVFDIGGEKVPLSVVRTWKEDAANAKAAIAASTKRWQEAAEIEKDEELQELRYVQRTLKEHPELAQEFAYLRSMASGQPMPGPVPYPMQYGQPPQPTLTPMVARLATQVQQVQARLQATEEERNMATAGQALDQFTAEFAKEHPQMTPEEVAAYVAKFGEEFLANTKAGDPGSQDGLLEHMRYHYYQTRGKQERDSLIQAARDQVRKEIDDQLKAGRSVAQSTVSPVSQKEVPWQPDPTVRSFEDAHQAAAHDPDLPWAHRG